MTTVKHAVAKKDMNARGNGEVWYLQYQLQGVGDTWVWPESAGLTVDGRLPQGTFLAADRCATVRGTGDLPDGTRVKKITQEWTNGRKVRSAYKYGTVGRFVKAGKIVTIQWDGEALEAAPDAD